MMIQNMNEAKSEEKNSDKANIAMIDDLTENDRMKYYKTDGSGGTKFNKMNDLYKDFKSLKIPAIFYRNSFDINMFDDRGNEVFVEEKTYKVGPKGKKKDYILPKGWIRYGLKALDGRYGNDNTWLHPFNHPNNWYRVYFGTGGVDNKTIPGFGYKKMNSVDAMANIYKGGFYMTKVAAYGPGVYCSPDPKHIESNYCGKISIDTKKGTKTYKYMLQCCVDPNQVKCGNNVDHSNKTCHQVGFGSSDVFQAWGPLWIAKNPSSIRVYGILIKDADNDIIALTKQMKSIKFNNNTNNNSNESKNDTSNESINNNNNNNNNSEYIIPKPTNEQRKIFNETSKAKKEQRNKCCITLNKESIKKKIEVIKKAEQITNDILSKKPSGDAGKKDTVLHVFNKMLGGNALMYDSSKGINCPDNENILMNPNMNHEVKEPEFCLTLSSLDGECKDDNKMDENDTMIELNKCIKQDKSHPILNNFKEKLAKVYNIKSNQVIIKDVYAGTVNIIYVLDLDEDQRKKHFKKDGSTNINETQHVINKMGQLFRDFQALNIPALFYRNSFDIGMFDDRGNKTFSNGTTYKVGPKGKEKEYTQPKGYVRYGLKVLDGRYGSNHSWLHPFQDPGNWYRVFHGTGSIDNVSRMKRQIPGYGYSHMNSVDAMANIHKGGFHKAVVAACGPGVYCSPKPNYGYHGKWTIDTMKGTKTYEYLLQCCVNPNQVSFHGDIWVAKEPASIRAYGILIKEV